MAMTLGKPDDDRGREFAADKEAAVNGVVNDCLSEIRRLLHGHLFSPFLRGNVERLLEGFETKLLKYGLGAKDVGIIAERVFRRIHEVIKRP